MSSLHTHVHTEGILRSIDIGTTDAAIDGDGEFDFEFKDLPTEFAVVRAELLAYKIIGGDPMNECYALQFNSDTFFPAKLGSNNPDFKNAVLLHEPQGYVDLAKPVELGQERSSASSSRQVKGKIVPYLAIGALPTRIILDMRFIGAR